MLQRVRFPPLPGGGSVAPLAGEAGAFPGSWRENGGEGEDKLVNRGLEMAGDGRRLGPANLDFQRFELGLKEAAAHAGLCRLWGV